MTQEVFLRVWNRADHGRGKDLFGGGCSNCEKFVAESIAKYKSSPRTASEMPSLYDEEDEEQPVPGWMIDRAALGPDVQLERAEQRRILQALIDALPDEKREIFQMVYEDEVALREVAERLAIPEGTVKSRLFHARRQLAEAWGRRYGRG